MKLLLCQIHCIFFLCWYCMYDYIIHYFGWSQGGLVLGSYPPETHWNLEIFWNCHIKMQLNSNIRQPLIFLENSPPPSALTQKNVWIISDQMWTIFFYNKLGYIQFYSYNLVVVLDDILIIFCKLWCKFLSDKQIFQRVKNGLKIYL